MLTTLPVQEIVGGRYVLGAEVAQLRTSTLREATDQKSGQPVLVRCSYIGTEEMDQARMQARAAAQRLASLRHRNLPRILDLVEDGPSLYAVQEEFRGKPMETIPVPLEPELLRRYAEQVLSALHYLHSQDPSIVHRDVHPGTVLVSPHGTLQLMGTDLAKVVAAAVSRTVFRGVGSPEYASPEQLMGEPSHLSHDLYAAGALFYYLATGKPPEASLKRMRATGPLEGLPEDLPEGLVTIINQLMAPEPEERPASAGAALDELRRLMGVAGTDIPQFMLVSKAAAPSAPAQVVEGGDLPSAPAPAPTGSGSVKIPTATVTPSGAQKKSMWQLLFGGKEEKTEKAVKIKLDKPVIQTVPDDHSSEAAEIRESHPWVNLEEMELDLKIARILPETAARSIQGICIGMHSQTEILVAVKDPGLIYIYDHVDYATQSRYRAVLRGADPAWIDRAMGWAYKNPGDTAWRTWVDRKALDAVALVVANPMADAANLGEEITHPIIVETERIIKEALAVGTSDIHMEAFESRTEVRYRIDGVLQPAATFKPEQGSAMVKRIKVMANMDIAQERTTQGGRISLALGDKKYDLRVSIVPVAHGESVVMRVLKKGSFNLTLSDLGIDPGLEAKYRVALSQPYGIILVCGPTGSGKSTTLYASLKELMRPDRKLLTVEDPVEYEMDGLVQVQVNMAPKDDDQKTTFAKALREFLRQDPEVILVGEIRDPETAGIALQASLTGHLVLSTVHTNDSVGVVARMGDLGCKPFLVASTLRCGLSQRLARRICSNCREEVEMDPELKAELVKEGVPEPHRAFRGVGCKECRMTGYKGRIGIYEVMEVSTPVKNLIAREAREEDIRAQLATEGFRSLYQNGLEKVSAGSITFEEVQRVCES